VRAQPAPLVPPQLLGRKPAEPLDEAALDLAEVDRRIERAPDVVELSASVARLQSVGVARVVR